VDMCPFAAGLALDLLAQRGAVDLSRGDHQQVEAAVATVPARAAVGRPGLGRRGRRSVEGGDGPGLPVVRAGKPLRGGGNERAGATLRVAMESGTIHTTEPERTDSLARDISRLMVGLFKDHVGRGPTVAKTYIEDDIVVCMLHDTMTKAERTLTEEGKADEVRQLRRSFQGLFRDRAIEGVEQLLGREVVAFLSDHAVDPDWAVEAFVLAPADAAQS